MVFYVFPSYKNGFTKVCVGIQRFTGIYNDSRVSISYYKSSDCLKFTIIYFFYILFKITLSCIIIIYLLQFYYLFPSKSIKKIL